MLQPHDACEVTIAARYPLAQVRPQAGVSSRASDHHSEGFHLFAESEEAAEADRRATPEVVNVACLEVRPAQRLAVVAINGDNAHVERLSDGLAFIIPTMNLRAW